MRKGKIANFQQKNPENSYFVDSPVSDTQFDRTLSS